jgi:hypothetical protein
MVRCNIKTRGEGDWFLARRKIGAGGLNVPAAAASERGDYYYGKNHEPGAAS